MIRAAASRSQLTTLAGAGLIAIGGIVAALAVSALSGTKTGFILAILAIFGPAFAYFAIVAPLVLPFGLYVGLVPFDNLLSVSAFGTLTKFLGAVSGAALILYLLRTRRALMPGPSLFLWAALTVWAATTAFWALDSQLVFAQVGTLLELVVLYAAISVFPADRAAVRWTMFAVIVGGIAAAAYGAYLFHNGTDIYYGGRLRITTDTGAIDPNQFAAAMLLPVALCLTWLLHTRKLFVGIANAAALAMLLLGVTLSASRGAVLAICLMVVYFLVRSRNRLRLLAFMAIGALVAAPLSTQSQLWERFGEALTTGGNGRMSIWRVGVQAAKQHWLLGAGFGNFPLAYDRVFLQTAHLNWADASWHRGSHNLLVGASVELGLIGVALLIGAWAAQFFMLRDIGSEDPEYPERIALEATVIGTFFAALFLDVMTFKYVWLT
ncbi:MAG: O-antigen ligase family protein, partial [Candidatus Eremiobacteraeota bacterium]|nr:O-antigen ligase family protein [Candidatus Eremiobacteraeota bacterium]